MNALSLAKRVIVRGGGEMASGVIRRLHLAGFSLLALEQPNPECIRRTVSFAEAVYENEISIEGVTGRLINSLNDANAVIEADQVPILIDPTASVARSFRPELLIDARMLKEGTDSSFSLAPTVIGLGPGFTAGEDCWAVIETNRGHNLGRVIYHGQAEPNTGIPGQIASVGSQRILRSPADGIFGAKSKIADLVTAGQVLGDVNDRPLTATIDGCLRGLIRPASEVRSGQKIGDIDPRGKSDYCYQVSEKANAIAGGVLEAALTYLARTN